MVPTRQDFIQKRTLGADVAEELAAFSLIVDDKELAAAAAAAALAAAAAAAALFSFFFDFRLAAPLSLPLPLVKPRTWRAGAPASPSRALTA